MSSHTADTSKIEEYVQTKANYQPIYQYVADHGDVITMQTEVVTIAGLEVRLSQDITEADRSLISDAVQATKLLPNSCFGNALRLWEYDHRFAYTEGFGMVADFDGDMDHAWCMLDGDKLVDLIPQYEQHYGVIFTDESIISKFGLNAKSHGIFRDRTNHQAFLREQGYLGSNND